MARLSETLLIEGLQKEVVLLIEQLRGVEGAISDLCAEQADLPLTTITQLQALDHALQRAEDVSSLLSALPDRLVWKPEAALSITELYNILKLKGSSFDESNAARNTETALEMFVEEDLVDWL